MTRARGSAEWIEIVILKGDTKKLCSLTRIVMGRLVFQFNVQRANALVRFVVVCACRLGWLVMRFIATINATMNAPLVADDGEKLDVIVFSHGLSGFRTCNANVACELAARGCVVFCVEHRDGSATASASSGENRSVLCDVV